QHCTAAGAEHDAVAQRELGEQRGFAVTKRDFALDLEDGGNRDAKARLELEIGIDERLAETARELAAERGLSRSGKAHQEKIAAMKLHVSRLAYRARSRYILARERACQNAHASGGAAGAWSVRVRENARAADRATLAR